MTSRILSIDIETYSDVDIDNGVYRYVDSPAFEILLFAYAFDNEEVKIIDVAREEKLPADVLSALTDSKVEKHAFNASFERVCIRKFYKLDLKIDQWWCTKVHAAMYGLPGSLKDVAKVLRLDEQKDTAGTLLINYFSKPCRPTASNGMRLRNLPEHDPDKWALFAKYCKQDVATERAISNFLDTHYIKYLAEEKQFYWDDQKINDTGIGINMDLVNSIINYNNKYRTDLLKRSNDLTGLDNSNSLTQLKPWLQSKGVSCTQITKDTIDDLSSATNDPTVKEVLRIRSELSKTSVTKYERMAQAVCSDGRVHGALQFYGANRTGRFAGRIIQVQNFPQNHMAELDEVRNLVKAKDWDYLEMMYDDIQDVFKQLLRTALIPSEGNTFIVADYSAIEARITAWFAHEEWAEKVFHEDGKIYERTASQMFGVPMDKITKELRQRGKVAVLACGYGGGAKAMENMDIKHRIPVEEYPELVNAWRKANPHIVAMWSKIEQAAKKVISEGGIARMERIKFKYAHNNLFIQLPSSRWLTYFDCHLNDNGTIEYYGSDTKGWSKQTTWGGKLFENIVQATARDCLVYAIHRVESFGFKIVMHVHDEIIAESSIDEAAIDEITGLGVEGLKDLMSVSNGWDEGLWLPAAGYQTPYYRKD